MDRGRGKTYKLFANLEKKNDVNKLITKLNFDGRMIQKQSIILNETAKFYKTLYASKVELNEQLSHIDKFLNNRLINKSDEQQKLECEEI